MTDQTNSSGSVLTGVLASLRQFSSSNVNSQLFSENIQRATNGLEQKAVQKSSQIASLEAKALARDINIFLQ